MNADGGLYIEDDGYGKNTAEIALQKVIDNGEALRVEYVSIDGACTDAAPKQIPEFENLIAIDLCISRLWAVDAYDFHLELKSSIYEAHGMLIAKVSYEMHHNCHISEASF